MRRPQPKSHTISQVDSAWTLALPALAVLIVLVALVVLGMLGETGTHDAVRAEEHAPAGENIEPIGAHLIVHSKG